MPLPKAASICQLTYAFLMVRMQIGTLSQKDVDPYFLDYEDEDKGLHTPGVCPHSPMGQRELSPPGATFSTWNSVAQ